MLLDIKKTKTTRISLLESNSSEAFQLLREDFWSWHYEDSLSDAAKLLLGTELGWEQTSQIMTPPVGEVISPLGHALAHTDENVREAALQVLDTTVNIPSGTVLIGEECAPLEMEPYKIGIYPVTNAQYLNFLLETGHEPPNDWTKKGELNYEIYGLKGDHPIVWVSCKDAASFAEYVGGRLPTFQEWQYAARGYDDRTFPWGHEIDKPRCNTAELGAEGTTPIGTFVDGKSPFGCYDMMGNIWEWTSTPYDDEENFNVACGGAWYYNHDYSTCISYDFFSKDYAEFVIGFRVAI